jgi:hypothetical protein
LYFPAGVYIISDTLKIPPYCNLQGDGPESTIFYFYVPTWTSTIAYASGVLVYDSASLTYYRSVAAVPAGQVVVANPTYWTATTLPAYIFRTADSLQQTGANIGTNGALPPGFLTMSGMKFMTNQTHDGCLIQAAQDCAFESVNIAGPKTTATLTTAADNTACVRFDTTAAIVCQDIVWNHGSFSGMVYGVKTAEQIESVTFSNGAFDTLFQGVYLGETPSPAVGPTGVRVVQNFFDNIYGEGIVIENVGNNCSAYNSFYDVGNHFLGTANPATPVIDINGLNGLNNVSIGDMFERTTQYASDLHPRIKLNNLNGIALGQNVSNIVFYQLDSAGAIPYNYANQLGLDYDDKGQLSRTGKVSEKLLNELNALDFYQQKFPKSLGFEFVKDFVLPMIESYKIPIEDKMRTFTEHLTLQMALALWHISNLKHDFNQELLDVSTWYGIDVMNHKIKEILEKYNLNVEDLIQ